MARPDPVDGWVAGAGAADSDSDDEVLEAASQQADAAVTAINAWLAEVVDDR